MIKQVKYPREAIVAITLNCNARCVMCNIWQNKINNEVKPEFYRKLPPTLREINITGGEPFLRNDLPEIVKIMKITCPNARLLINTNGYLIGQIQKTIPNILKEDKNIAVRVSLDGWGKRHTKIRGLPQFFEKAMESICILRKSGVKDLGISYTLMEQNKKDLLKIYNYCAKNGLEFSLTVATNSPIYFGSGKIGLRPSINQELKHIFHVLAGYEYKHLNPKHWIRAWFDKKLLNYMNTGIRPLMCHAAGDFFYIDSRGKVYSCHLKPWLIGDLTTQSYEAIFRSNLAQRFQNTSKHCHDCWMVCSARSSIKSHFIHILPEIIFQKLKHAF